VVAAGLDLMIRTFCYNDPLRIIHDVIFNIKAKSIKSMVKDYGILCIQNICLSDW